MYKSGELPLERQKGKLGRSLETSCNQVQYLEGQSTVLLSSPNCETRRPKESFWQFFFWEPLMPSHSFRSNKREMETYQHPASQGTSRAPRQAPLPSPQQAASTTRQSPSLVPPCRPSPALSNPCSRVTKKKKKKQRSNIGPELPKPPQSVPNHPNATLNHHRSPAHPSLFS